MARQDPTLITFRLPREVVARIEDRTDCPPRAGAGLLGGASLWIRELVLKELGLDPEADTQYARDKATKDYLLTCASYWRLKKVLNDLGPEPKGRDWAAKVARAEKQISPIEDRLELFPRTLGHDLGCDCELCQEAASSFRD